MKNVFLASFLFLFGNSFIGQISTSGCYLSGAILNQAPLAGCGNSPNFCNLAAVFVPAFSPSACGTSTLSGGTLNVMGTSVILPAGCTATIAAQFMKRNAWGAPINPSGTGCSNSGMDSGDNLMITNTGGVVVSQSSTMVVNVGTCGAYPVLGTYTTAVSSLIGGCSNSDGTVKMILTGGTFTIGGQSNRSDELITYTINMSGTCGPSCNIVLPIDLIGFYAEKKNDVVELKWAVSAEKNIEKYSIEKSIDAVNWLPLVTIMPETKILSKYKSYNTIDNQPLKGLNYYRLKSHELDGTIKTFGVAFVNCNSSNNAIWLNQDEELITIYFNEALMNNNFNIFDITGRLIKTVKSTFSNSVSIPKNELPKGLLMLGCENQPQIGLIKLIIY